MEFSDEKLNQIATVAYSFRETVYHTYECAIDLLQRDIQGVWIECGIGAGAQIATMQKAKMDFGLNTAPWILAFDSFEGIPLGSEKDAEQPGIGAMTHDPSLPERERLVSSGITVHSVEEVKYTFERFDIPMEGINFIKGWFQDTLPHLYSITDIAFLRLDGDLYESTMVCMVYLYDKVVIGGTVVIDDYSLQGCKAAIHDYFNEMSLPVPELTILPNSNGVAYFTKR